MTKEQSGSCSSKSLKHGQEAEAIMIEASYIADTIEKTPEYKGAMVFINQQLNKEFTEEQKQNDPIEYWRRKKNLLSNYGVQWRSPLELNPDLAKVLFEEKQKKDKERRLAERDGDADVR